MSNTKQYIRITSTVDGFRRAGVAHARTPTDWPAEAFTATQLAQIEAEPRLTVQQIDKEVEADSADGKADDKKAGKKAAGK